jgi:hypothetical protein
MGLGVGCGLEWLLVLRQLLYYPRFTVIRVLVKSVGRIIMRVLEFIPVFVGFTLLGSLVFWKSHYFLNLSRTAMTQFCFMTGDSIRDITHNMAQKAGFMPAVLYSVVFVLLYMHIIHNLLIAIVREVFA